MMPVNERRNSLRAALEQKSTEELEELLALDFSEQEDAEPDVEYIMTIMEVINEREEHTAEKQKEVDAAWRDFQDYLQERRKEESETGIDGEPSRDHPCKPENGHAPRKSLRILRYCAVAAVVIVLFCGTAYALGWNVFQALAGWTEETFYFLTGNEPEEAPIEDVFRYMRLEVEERSDTPAIPAWAPEGTVQIGEINVTGREDRVEIQGTFSVEEKVFTIWITVYDDISDGYSGTYQRDNTGVEVYEINGIEHYIMNNKENISAMWTNGCVEGHIQGELSIEDLQRMMDSIYEE